MADPVLRILYGPPGTGKTWGAARDAVRILEPTVTDAQIEARHRALVAAGRILWVTFHPSYSYEDFVEGFRPVAQGGGIVYEPLPGPFRQACTRVSEALPVSSFFTPGQQIQSSTNQLYEVVHIDRGAVVLKNIRVGGRGYGKHTPVAFWVIERLRQTGYRSDALGIPGSDATAQGNVENTSGIDKQTLFGMTGPLRAVWEEIERRAGQQAAASNPVVLVIDEINRADLSRVFGELITLLERNKRLGASEERRVHLPYSGQLFGVPSDLHIIGTMNTADRSLSSMDHALRRRFDFKEVGPEPARCASPYGGVALAETLTRWNQRITALLSREHRIGHSYFMQDRLERLRNQEQFADSDDGRLRTIAVAIRQNILPLLMEYFHDDWRKVDLVFGRDFRTAEGGLLEAVEFTGLAEEAGDVVDLTDVTDFTVPGFWDPRVGTWNADTFRAAITEA